MKQFLAVEKLFDCGDEHAGEYMVLFSAQDWEDAEVTLDAMVGFPLVNEYELCGEITCQ